MQATIDAEVRRTLAAYCHTVDDGRFDEFAVLWAPDAVLVVQGDEVQGRDAIRDWIQNAQPPERRGRHLTANSLLTVQAPDRVRAVSDFFFVGRSESGAPRIMVTGRYLDEFTPHDGRWVFARREIVIG